MAGAWDILGRTGSMAGAGAPLGPVGAGIGGGIGLLTGILGSNAEEEQNKKIAEMKAAEIRAQPWTKMASTTQLRYNKPKVASAVEGVLGGVGAAQGIAKGFQGSAPEMPGSSGSMVGNERMGLTAPGSMELKSSLNPSLYGNETPDMGNMSPEDLDALLKGKQKMSSYASPWMNIPRG